MLVLLTSCPMVVQLHQIGVEYPIYNDPNFDPSKLDFTCFCDFNATERWSLQSTRRNQTALDACKQMGGTLFGHGCNVREFVPNVFLLSIILFAATYVVSVMLKDFKTSSFFPTKLRQIVSDFSVVIAIASMTLVDNWISLPTPKLYVPDKFKVSFNN